MTMRSPYGAGVMIGLLQIPMFLLLGASLGTSGSFGSVACWILRSGGEVGCFPFLKNWCQLGIVIGIALGAYSSRKWFGTNRPAISSFWGRTLGPSRLVGKRVVMAFCGGFLFLFGARMADGCTSGNGISGIALLSVGSFVVIGCMFALGILVSMIYPKR